MKRSKHKVVIALSGGVDSSVAAALLKKQGFSVVGVFMRFWSEKQNRCCNLAAEKRARTVCKKLEVPFYALSLEKEFKEKVVDPFLDAIEKGTTPNPCVICNKEIKFKLLLDKLSVFDADYLATGHYAKIEGGKIFRGKEKAKDQSYFLWKIKKEWKNKILFPLGDLKKEEVRLVAKKQNLPTALTSESQEICFVGNDMYNFLSRHLSSFPGKVVDSKGVVIGTHDGLFHYTIGQRKKIGLPGGPYYVLEKDKEKNNLVVTRNEKDLFRKEVVLRDMNFLKDVSFPLKIRAKIRYRGELKEATLKKEKLIFLSPQRAITPGQSAVFYSGRELVGGGTIK